MEERKFDIGECSHAAIQHRSREGVDDELVLQSKHKIFLSHSGVQKEFVEHLCKALEDCCRYPFFDKRPESLPKGKEFPGLIVKAARQCQLLIVVVSEEYFMSKWPMIELNAFVQAKKEIKSNMDVAILPLFYGLSVSDLKDEKRRQRWLEKWEAFAKDDPIEGRIKVEDWSFAVDELTKFNGLSYDQELKEIVAYENEIVSHVCTLVSPDIKWHDSHVQGNAHEVLFDKMNQIGLSPMYKVKVVGIYGVGGIGKTTICKTLCNELFNQYAGRVCHVEFNSTCSNSKELLQNAIINLTRQSASFVRELGEGECKDVLHKNLHKQRTFLALDNVWDNYNSIKQAKMFLETPCHEDSLVLVTARSQSTLARLGVDGDACLEMPELGHGDAKCLFLFHAARWEEFTTREDMDSIEWCVKKCYFCKGFGRDYHYHPLALEALGRQLCGFKEKPLEWVQRLSEVWNSRSYSGEEIVFDVLRSSFDLLQSSEQTLFMDVGFFLQYLIGFDSWSCEPWISGKELLCVVYKKDEFEIQRQLDSLKRKGLLQDADLTLGKITMHDLYHEFVRLEAIGKLGAATDLWDRKWVLVDGDNEELEVTPAGGCWQKLSRLSVWQQLEDTRGHLHFDYHPPSKLITSLEGIEWRYFSNVLVLQLCGLQSVHGRLNLKGMTCLRSLQVYNCKHLESLEGLESLKHLTFFQWSVLLFESDVMETHVVGQFPASLKYLYIEGQCVLSGSTMLARCNNLIKLKLAFADVGVLLDLSNCSSLEVVEIHGVQSLQTLLGLAAKGSSRLHTLGVLCMNVIHIPGLHQLDGLVRLDIKYVFQTTWEVPCLLSLTKLQMLRIGTHANLVEHCIPHQLQELYYILWSQCQAPCLSALKQLQVLDFSFSHSLIQMYGMGDLPALQSLNLSHCSSLERLPDLSKSRSLKELNLDCCSGLELHEEDFEMLATLPLLHPVWFSNTSDNKRIRLDIIGKQVLRYLGPALYGPDSWLAWKEGEWEELELRRPPISIGDRGVWDTYTPIKFDMEELNDPEIDMEELDDVDSDMEELDDVDSDVEENGFGIENISQGNSNLNILRPALVAFGCSFLLWVVVDDIKEFLVAKIFTCS